MKSAVAQQLDEADKARDGELPRALQLIQVLGRQAGPDGVDYGVPVISTFFGIVIRMFYQEHEPPHFHAEYQGQQATFLVSGELLAGEVRSSTARRLIREWAALHRGELEANWARIKAGLALDRIAPLE